MTLEFLLKVVFWFSIAALGYTYIGYPLLLVLLNRIRGRSVNTAENTPTVTVVITAYNEERDLAGKLANTLALDYPKEKLEIIVVDDGSEDATPRVLSGLPVKAILRTSRTRSWVRSPRRACVCIVKLND
jgi:cellulose synthase/poly-beta-1,6-N-acetylglucosamine synthase-like glycosyltransferase